MKNIKIEHAVYAAWDYELELEHLNEMSEKGWQLIHGGCFYTKYERDDSVVYRYQLDHNMRIENRMRYIDTFREQGWEYINSTFNGWHYFRKPYDSAKPAEEYEIYSDRPSREEMAGRLGKVMMALTIIVAVVLIAAVIAMCTDPKMARLGIIAEMTAVLALVANGSVQMRRVGKGVRSKRRFRFEVFAAVVVLGLIWFDVFATAQQEMTVQSSSGTATLPIEVSLPDWVDIEFSGEDGAQLTIADEKREVREIASGDIFLMPGKYTITAQSEAENSVTITVE